MNNGRDCSLITPRVGLTSDQPQGFRPPAALILASNRGPVEYQQTPGGNIVACRGSGGVVTALDAAAARVVGAMPVTWVAAAMTEGDRLLAAMGDTRQLPTPGPAMQTRFVTADAEAYHLHYNAFCNPVLWFLQHGLWEHLSPGRSPESIAEAWRRGYVALNERFAAAIVTAAKGQQGAAIMLQDYHLYLAAGYVRARLPGALISHFVHIPWPEPQQWALLPAGIHQAIYASICANDLVGMQTVADAERFLRGCAAFLDGARVDYQGKRVLWNGRVTHVRAYPISIDVVGLRRRVAAPDMRAILAKLRPLCGTPTVIRVDRLDPSKNTVRGFRALHQLLEGRPDLHGRLRFLAFLVPSRAAIAEYRSYHEEVMAAAHAVNVQFGRGDWQPVQVFYESNYDQAIAAMTLYDVLLVNPLADGMNLVAKEGPTVNERHGVLVLSEGAGACEQLRAGALAIDPRDVSGTARALAEALAMPHAERQRRAELLRNAVASYDVADWLWSQIEDLVTLRPATPYAGHELSGASTRGKVSEAQAPALVA